MRRFRMRNRPFFITGWFTLLLGVSCISEARRTGILCWSRSFHIKLINNISLLLFDSLRRQFINFRTIFIWGASAIILTKFKLRQIPSITTIIVRHCISWSLIAKKIYSTDPMKFEESTLFNDHSQSFIIKQRFYLNSVRWLGEWNILG